MNKNTGTPTPNNVLRERLLDPSYAKSEVEHYAAREIEALETQLSDLQQANEKSEAELLLKIMKLFAENDACDELYWNNELEPWVNCSDFFWWGCGDGEDIETDEDLELLEQCFKDSEDHPTLLYCARRRKERPQGAYYKYLKDEAELFNACGPERKTGSGNPQTPEEAMEDK